MDQGGPARRFLIDVTPLRASRQFRLPWIGQAISDLGSGITMVAVPFQVFGITHSSLAVGLVSLCELVPLVTLSVLGGAIADATDRRQVASKVVVSMTHPLGGLYPPGPERAREPGETRSSHPTSRRVTRLGALPGPTG